MLVLSGDGIIAARRRSMVIVQLLRMLLRRDPSLAPDVLAAATGRPWKFTTFSAEAEIPAHVFTGALGTLEGKPDISRTCLHLAQLGAALPPRA